jgi:hypothetical protein
MFHPVMALVFRPVRLVGYVYTDRESSVSCETVNMTLNKKIISRLEVDDDRDAVLNL